MQAAYECRGVGGQELGGNEAAQEGTAVFEVALRWEESRVRCSLYRHREGCCNKERSVSRYIKRVVVMRGGGCADGVCASGEGGGGAGGRGGGRWARGAVVCVCLFVFVQGVIAGERRAEK